MLVEMKIENNMQDLVFQLKLVRRENAGGRRINLPKFNGRNPRVIRKKDIKHHPGRRGIGNSFTSSKRKIIRQQGITRKN